jgi:ubiquinone/menaquinone biosynthesis C-methylase UbiE
VLSFKDISPRYDLAMSQKDREHIRDFYERLGDGEWDRLEATMHGRVSFEVHRRFLQEFVEPGQRVLEIGAGPGRFTIELAGLGTRVVVADISPEQLRLHELHVGPTSAEQAVESRELLDICDVTHYADASFDVVVAYGGPLSYAFEDGADALRGLFRVLKPGGVVIASVMSLLGSWRFFLPGTIADAKVAGVAANDLVLSTGDLRHFQAEHICQMYRSTDVEGLVMNSGGDLLSMSSSNWASLGDENALAELANDDDHWQNFLEHEIRACREPGALDGGTHLLFAARSR